MTTVEALGELVKITDKKAYVTATVKHTQYCGQSIKSECTISAVANDDNTCNIWEGTTLDECVAQARVYYKNKDSVEAPMSDSCE